MKKIISLIKLNNKIIIIFLFGIFISIGVGVIIGSHSKHFQKEELSNNNLSNEIVETDIENIISEQENTIELDEQTESVEQTKPVEQEKPAEQTKPVEQEKPAEQTKPFEQKKPAEQTKPFEQKKPAEQTKPVEQTKPKQEENNIPEYPASVSLLPSGDAHLSVGDTFQLNVSTNPAQVKNNSGTWKSTDESVATVDSNGKITGVRNGFCNIIYTSANGIQSSKHIGVYYTILGTKNINRVIYNQNGIKITAKNFIYDMEADSSPMYFSITNNSGSTIGVFVSNKPSYASTSDWGVTINGKQINYNQMGSMWINYDVVNNSTKNGYISFKQDYLRSNQIRQINTLSFYLIFTDENSTQKFSSDLITINL